MDGGNKGLPGISIVKPTAGGAGPEQCRLAARFCFGLLPNRSHRGQGQLQRHWLAALRESLRIFTDLVQRAPGYVQWAQDKKFVEEELTALRAAIASSPDGTA